MHTVLHVSHAQLIYIYHANLKFLQKELLQGCELIATGCLVICNNDTGCSRPARQYLKQAARAVVTTVSALVQVFYTHKEHSAETLAAQKTGAVWSTCDALLKVPQGNRNSIRRELFTYALDCKETLDEFTALIEQGAAVDSLTTIQEDDNTTENETTWNDFMDGNQDQYTEVELPIATSCLALVKSSRGSINVVLKACEGVGERVSDDDDSTELLQWIASLTNLARSVGDGMTDLGTCLYPPLEIKEDGLPKQVTQQRDAIVTLQEYILDAPVELPEEVTEMASKLKGAAQTRCQEAQDAISAALETK